MDGHRFSAIEPMNFIELKPGKKYLIIFNDQSFFENISMHPQIERDIKNKLVNVGIKDKDVVVIILPNTIALEEITEIYT